MTVHQAETTIVNAPPVEWAEKWLEIKAGLGATMESDAFIRNLDDKAERAALLSGYIGGRELGLDHAHAVKRAQKALAAVRKALGYSYPDRYLFDF